MAVKSNALTLSSILLVIVFLFGEIYYVTDGFQVGVKMYFNQTSEIGEDYLNFGAHQPNFDDYSALLLKVRWICTVGYWTAYRADDYKDPMYNFGSYFSSEYDCNSRPITGMKSFRFLGSSDPTNASLSLYEGISQTGKELLVEYQALTGINFNAQSLVSTGNSEWKLFEGDHLDGNSFCFPRPYAEYIHYGFADTIPPAWNLARIGSVFRGCNIGEIQEYKIIHNL